MPEFLTRDQLAEYVGKIAIIEQDGVQTPVTIHSLRPWGVTLGGWLETPGWSRPVDCDLSRVTAIREVEP